MKGYPRGKCSAAVWGPFNDIMTPKFYCARRRMHPGRHRASLWQRIGERWHTLTEHH